MRHEAVYKNRRRVAAGVAIALSASSFAAYKGLQGDTRPGCAMPARAGQGVDQYSHEIDKKGGDAEGDALIVSPDGTVTSDYQLGPEHYDDADSYVPTNATVEFPHADPAACRQAGGAVLKHLAARESN